MQTANLLDFAHFHSETKGWTECFRQAADALEACGGGLLYVPAGTYETCSIRLKSHMRLHLEQGALLRFLDDPSLYEIVETGFEGVVRPMYMACIYAADAEDVSVTGGGTLDGQGRFWWEHMKTLPCDRPYLIHFERCSHILLDGLTLKNSPAWTVHPAYCEDVVIHHLTIKNPADSPNTDGIDPDSCRNVRISDCLIDVGDDCIAIKAGTEETSVLAPCENILITNCNMVHGHGGVVIGSEMSGGVQNVAVSNCVFQDTDRGVRIKTRRRRGGIAQRLSFQNIIMDRVMCPFTVNMYYFCGPNGKEKYVWDKEAYPVDASTPLIRDIRICDITVNDARAAAGFFYGLPEMPIENVSLSNISVRMAADAQPGFPAMMDGISPMAGEGFFFRNVRGLQLGQVSVYGAKQEFDADSTVRPPVAVRSFRDGEG